MIKNLARLKINHRLLWLFLSAFSLWLRCGVPLFALSNAGDDDALFVRLARPLALGHWLGHYDNVTLAKGMFYPLFIALSGFCALPLKLAEQIVYLLVSAMTSRFVARRTGSAWVGTVLFALLAFNPLLYSLSLARVIREGLYISLSFGVVVLIVMVDFSRAPLRRRLWLAAGGGLMMGGFWLTREEGPWIVPAALMPLVIAVIALVRGKDRAGLRALFACMVVFAVCFFGLNNLVAAINQRAYGVYETVEFKSHNFVRAYSALANINPDSWQPKIVFPKDARQAAYEVSPAARELEPYLEGDGGNAWRIGACTQMSVPLDQCHEILAGWFMWALRDAVTAAGHTAARDADAFYGQLADQIEAACNDGKLSCRHRRPSMAPAFRTAYVREALAPLRDLLVTVFTFAPGVPDSVPAYTGTRRQLDTFMDLTGVALQATETRYDAAGWGGSKNGAPHFVLQSGADRIELSQSVFPQEMPADDKHPWPTSWFDLSFTCQQTCDLGIVVPGKPIVFVPVHDLKTGMEIDQLDAAVDITLVKTGERFPVTARRQAMQRRIISVIDKFYRVALPLASIGALVGLALATILRRGPPIALYALALSSLIAIFCRIGLLAYIDATSLPANNELYASPATPFVVIFTVTGLYAGWAALRNRRV